MKFKGWPELNWLSRLARSGYRFPYSLKDVFDVPFQLRRVKWFFQRAWRGWADCDTWDLGSYLMLILPPAIRHLSKHSSGVPPELCDDGGVDEGAKKWATILEEMASGLEAGKHLEFDCDCPQGTKEEILHHQEEWGAKFENGKALLAKWWLCLWD